MQKDVIYIDVDDDITAIIGKLKTSKREIVAIVPPKRVGVLQSAVNLRLLARAAKQNKKHLVLVTANQALLGLAAAAAIPVAKTLQSKPEIPEIAALSIDDGNDVIDGSELPIGEHAKQADPDDPAPTTAALGATALQKEPKPKSDTSAKRAAAIAAAKAKKGPKVPNFDLFRKKLVFIIAAVILLVGFLVWAIVFAPRAHLTITTRTSNAAVNQLVTVGPNTETSADDNALKAVEKTSQNDINIPFSATGKKDVGEKAKGTVRFSTRDTEALGTQIPAGTSLTTSSGAAYVTDKAIVISYDNRRGVDVAITAAERGSKYNGASGSLRGAPSGISASISDATSGGTDKTITVVTAADIETAKQKVDESVDKNAAKAELEKQFGDGTLVVQDSFVADTGNVQSNIAADSEAPNGQAALTGKASFSMYGVEKDVINRYLKQLLESQIDNKNEQGVRDTGVKDAKFSNVKRVEQGISANIATNGKIGPKIDEKQVVEAAKGKRIGEVKSALEAISGVENVDVKLSPFWVSAVPDDAKKIKVDFKLNDGS